MDSLGGHLPRVTNGFYGWASENLGKKIPTFEDIEKAVGLVVNWVKPAKFLR